VANAAESSCLLSPVFNAFYAYERLNCTDKRIVHSNVVRGYLAKPSTEIVLLNSLN
jgi:hypothetical protein